MGIKDSRVGEALNAAEIVEGVWLGDASDAMDTKTLTEKGINSVVNCAEKHTLTCQEYYPFGWNSVGPECDDAATYDILGHHLAAFVDCIDECVSHTSTLRVYGVVGIYRRWTLPLPTNC